MLSMRVVALFVESLGRQSEAKIGPLPNQAFHLNRAAMGFHYVFHYGEAQPGAALFAGTCLVHAIKPFENSVQIG